MGTSAYEVMLGFYLIAGDTTLRVSWLFRRRSAKGWGEICNIIKVRCPVEVQMNKSENLVNKTNLVHNLFLVYLFLVHLSISTCFGATMCPS